MTEVTLSSVERAAELLSGVTALTPVLTNRTLDEVSGTTAFLKCENFQRTGAFKFRGAYHAVARLIESSRTRTFVTISSGNHGQGLALACRILGGSAHVIMPRPFASVKQQAVLDFGATVHEVEGRPRAEVKLREVIEKFDARVIHPFNDPLVIAGQATVMMELLEQVRSLDVVMAPVGGGGLLSGLCIVAEALCPQVKIFACEPAEALDAIHSVKENRVVPMSHPNTMADGLRTSLGDRTLPILHRCLSGFFVVEEREIIQAMRFAYEHLKLVIEPSTAVALAPLLRNETQLKGKRVAVVLSGGNVDLSILQGAWERANS